MRPLSYDPHIVRWTMTAYIAGWLVTSMGFTTLAVMTSTWWLLGLQQVLAVVIGVQAGYLLRMVHAEHH